MICAALGQRLFCAFLSALLCGLTALQGHPLCLCEIVIIVILLVILFVIVVVVVVVVVIVIVLLVVVVVSFAVFFFLLVCTGCCWSLSLPNIFFFDLPVSRSRCVFSRCAAFGRRFICIFFFFAFLFPVIFHIVRLCLPIIFDIIVLR